MTAKWGSWRNIERADFDERAHFGIYGIRMVDQDGHPIPISRIAGIDTEGVIYIGRSGSKRPRTLAQRIREFQRGRPHSGAETYRLMRNCFKYLEHAYSLHRLQYQAMHLQADEGKIGDGEVMLHIKKEEARALVHYFDKYGELPPCNSNFPMWKDFIQCLDKVGRKEQS